jgi:SAM-dependent methyltransferase
MRSKQVCEVCSAEDTNHYVRIGYFDAWRCGSCKFFWLSGQVPDGVEHPNWDGPGLADYERYFGALRRREGACIIETLRDLHGGPQDFLDVGFGLGFFMDEVRHRFPASKITGLEDDAFTVDHIQKRLAGNPSLTIVHSGFMQAEALELGRFDIIAMLDTFEHIRNPRRVLERVDELLRDDGFFICKVPSSNGIFFRLIHLFHRFSFGLFRSAVALIWQVETAYPHIWYFNENNLRMLFESAGFEIIAVKWHPLLDSYGLDQRVHAMKESGLRTFLSSIIGKSLLRGVAMAQRLVPERNQDDLTVFARRKNASTG